MKRLKKQRKIMEEALARGIDNVGGLARAVYQASPTIRSGVHMKDVSDRLRHSSIKITMDTYSHVLDDAKRKAADVFDSIINKTKKTSKKKNLS